MFASTWPQFTTRCDRIQLQDIKPPLSSKNCLVMWPVRVDDGTGILERLHVQSSNLNWRSLLLPCYSIYGFGYWRFKRF